MSKEQISSSNSIVEINGRIEALCAQRNKALDEAAFIHGRYAVLEALVKEQQETIEKLTAEKRKRPKKPEE